MNRNIGFEIIAQQHKDWIESICERVNDKYKKAKEEKIKAEIQKQKFQKKK